MAERRLRLRYATNCSQCSAALRFDALAWYERTTQTWTCCACHDGIEVERDDPGRDLASIRTLRRRRQATPLAAPTSSLDRPTPKPSPDITAPNTVEGDNAGLDTAGLDTAGHHTGRGRSAHDDAGHGTDRHDDDRRNSADRNRAAPPSSGHESVVPGPDHLRRR